MADETPPINGNGEPPKIKLNLGTKPKTEPKDTAMKVVAKPPLGKSETTRIDLAQAVPSSSDTKRIDTLSVSKMTTMRVELVEPQRKAETTRIDLTAAAPKPAPRIDLTQEVGISDDLFKRNTMAVGPSVQPQQPLPPMTRPKTIQVKRPGAKPTEDQITTPGATAESVSEAKKSETARIDLPPEGSDRPTTRPKTIRIKRPDGTSGRKPLMIARPSDEMASESASAPISSVMEDGLTVNAADGEESAGTVFSILALVALLVTCVVVYVLAAQTIALDLPFPGRII